MHRNISILIPSFIPSGPVKGAIALANSLVESRSVRLVALKDGAGADADIDPRIELGSLAGAGHSLYHKARSYQGILKKDGGRARVSSISMCFSADMVNMMCRRHAITCSSIRGNLPENYRMDHGYVGLGAAFAHLFSLRVFDHVTAMTESMARQIRRYSGKKATVIGNFVDEKPLDSYRQIRVSNGSPRIVFLGSLTARKQPASLLRAQRQLREQGLAIRIDYIGSGPLLEEMRTLANALSLSESVEFHGQVSNPYPLMANADLLVLPSMSEGISRAALEALYLGVPCVMRDVDGNRELIRNGVNGMLFARESDLPEAIRSALAIAATAGVRRPVLLPDGFRQETCARQYLDLVDA